MNQHEFLAMAHAQWRGLPDAALAECSGEERVVLRRWEAQASQLELGALTDIILNCHNRFQFAKTYKVLWNDLRKTLAQPSNPNAPDHINKAMKAAMEHVVRQKLMKMAEWFEIYFADNHDRRQVWSGRVQWSIEVYAGKEGVGGAGCAGVVLVALGALLGSIVIRLIG